MIDYDFLDKIREVELDRIMQNPVYVDVESRVEMVDNGFGVMVPDRDAAKKYVIRGPVRLELRTSTLEYAQGNEEPFGVFGEYILFAKHDAIWLRRGLILILLGKKYKTENPVDLRLFGGIISRVCRLKMVGNIDDQPVGTFTKIYSHEGFSE